MSSIDTNSESENSSQNISQHSIDDLKEETQAYNFLDEQQDQIQELIEKIQMRGPDFIESISAFFFDKLKKLIVPLKFKKNIKMLNDTSPVSNSDKAFMCMEGEIGVGKSSTNNQIIYLYCSKNGYDHKDISFKFGRQCERVTTKVKTQRVGKIIIMDTPGTNDFQSELSDAQIQYMKNNALGEIFENSEQGVSCITQCVMIDEGGRLKETSVDSMARTFHSLTYSYPDFEPMRDGGPRINVVFTKLSRYTKEPDDIMIPGLLSESANSNVDQFDELIKKFKQLLSEKIHQDLSRKQSYEKIETKVDWILPKDNFYAFKIFQNIESMNVERQEITRLTTDIMNHGRWFVENFNLAKNYPTNFQSFEAEHIMNSLKNIFNTMIPNQIQIALDKFKVETQSQESCEKILEIETKINDLKSWILQCIEKFPIIFRKMPMEMNNVIQQLNFHFPLFMQDLVTLEAKKYLFLKCQVLLQDKNELNNQANITKSQHDTQIKNIQWQKSNEIQNLNSNHQINLNNTSKQYNERVDQMKAELNQKQIIHNQQLGNKDRQCESQVMNAKSGYEKNAKELKINYDNQLSYQMKQHQDALDQQSKVERDKLAQKMREYEVIIKQQKHDHDLVINQKDKFIQVKIKAHSERAKQQRASLTNDNINIQSRYENNVNNLKEEFSRYIENLKRGHQQQMYNKKQ